MKPMERSVAILLAVCMLAGCRPKQNGSASDVPWPGADRSEATPPLVKARAALHTALVASDGPGSHREPADRPPEKLFRRVDYDSAVGRLPAYLTPDPGDGKKHPAIIWIQGGFGNGIGDVWSPAKPVNDQTAAAYRQAGIVMMFPSRRGGNDNPGRREMFLGEVDDVIASAKFLETQEYVDGHRIYLGGHSTGGTLALLAAESTDRFRAVFAFGPVDDVRGYGKENLPFDLQVTDEWKARSPGYWMSSIRSPTFVFEGDAGGNLSSLRALQQTSRNPKVRFHPVHRASHFTILEPTNRLIAAGILADVGTECALDFSAVELNRPFAK